jgi:hypothetical protein
MTQTRNLILYRIKEKREKNLSPPLPIRHRLRRGGRGKAGEAGEFAGEDSRSSVYLNEMTVPTVAGRV